MNVGNVSRRVLYWRVRFFCLGVLTHTQRTYTFIATSEQDPNDSLLQTKFEGEGFGQSSDHGMPDRRGPRT